MKRKTLIYLLPLLLCAVTAMAQPNPLEGRWDLTVKQDTREWPSWLEVRHSGTHTFVGRFVSGGGSARPVSKVEINDNKFSFKIPPQWERGDGELQLEGTLSGNSMTWSACRAGGTGKGEP